MELGILCASNEDQHEEAKATAKSEATEQATAKNEATEEAPRKYEDDSKKKNKLEWMASELDGGGRCFTCKEPGHRARNCPRKNAGRVCFKCGMVGHIRGTLWQNVRLS